MDPSMFRSPPWPLDGQDDTLFESYSEGQERDATLKELEGHESDDVQFGSQSSCASHIRQILHGVDLIIAGQHRIQCTMTLPRGRSWSELFEGVDSVVVSQLSLQKGMTELLSAQNAMEKRVRGIQGALRTCQCQCDLLQAGTGGIRSCKQDEEIQRPSDKHGSCGQPNLGTGLEGHDIACDELRFDPRALESRTSLRSENRSFPLGGNTWSADSSFSVAELRGPGRSDGSCLLWDVPSTLSPEWPRDIIARSQKGNEMLQRPASTCRAMGEETGPGSSTGKVSRGILNPNGVTRVLWDALSACLLLVDILVTPYALAWDLPITGYQLVFFWSTVAFWTMDIPVTFNTGQQRNGELVMDRSVISLLYFRSWFWPDVVMIACDWGTMFERTLVGGDGQARLLRLVKVARLVRIVRVVKMLRIARDVEDMLDAAFGEGVAIVLRVLSIFAVVLWLNHVIACGWYAVGVAGSDTGGSWPQSTVDIRGSPVEYEALGAPFLYSSAFHWSMAQMTLGATEVPASNTFERLATITMLLVGLLFSSTLVSSLSAGLINSQLRAAENNERLLSLRKYLRQRGVSPQLSIRVRQQAVHRMQETQLLEESDVPAVTVLSASLRAQLRFDMYVPNLSRYPLFRLWTTLSADTLQNFCYSCVSFSFLPAHDDLFVAGAEAEAMYFILSGTVLYTQDPSTSMVSALQHDVVEHRYLCEACLWTEWTHVGTAEAMSRCEIVSVDPDGLLGCTVASGTVAKIFRAYGAIFHARVVGSKVLPTDMCVHHAGIDEIVMAMDRELREAISLDSLKYVQTQSVFQTMPHNFLSGMRQQVEDGRCTIIVSESGEPVRVTAVAVLQIEDAHGRIFVQIGSVDSDLRAQIELPGSKFLDGELPEDAADRILETKLGPVRRLVRHVHTDERTEDIYPSNRFNLLTKYLRTVIHYSLEEELEVPVVCAEWKTTPSKESHSRNKNQKDVFDLMSREVYLIKSGLKTFMYSWLDMAEYEEMSKQTHAEFLQTWCLALDIGRDVNTTRTSRLQFPLGPTRSSRNFESLPKA